MAGSRLFIVRTSVHPRVDGMSLFYGRPVFLFGTAATVSQDFGEVHGPAVGELRDLFAATEAVRDN
jgi:hypothetical protein